MKKILISTLLTMFLLSGTAQASEWWAYDPSMWPGCDGNVCTDADGELDAITIQTPTQTEPVREQNPPGPGPYPAKTGPKSYTRETNGDPEPECSESDDQPLRVYIAYCGDGDL